MRGFSSLLEPRTLTKCRTLLFRRHLRGQYRSVRLSCRLEAGVCLRYGASSSDTITVVTQFIWKAYEDINENCYDTCHYYDIAWTPFTEESFGEAFYEIFYAIYNKHVEKLSLRGIWVRVQIVGFDKAICNPPWNCYSLISSKRVVTKS